MKIRFNATFYTDGDFGFYKERVETFLANNNVLYKAADIHYDFRQDEDKIYVWLTADGDTHECKYALRDLLEGLMCSIRTCKHWLVKDIYDLLFCFYDDLWDAENIRKENTLSGNYDGTYLTLEMEE